MDNTVILPFRFSFGRLFIILVSATCVGIAYYIVFYQATVHSRSTITKDRWNRGELVDTLSDSVDGMEYSRLSGNNSISWSTPRKRLQSTVTSSHLSNRSQAVSGTFQAIGNSQIWIYSAFFELSENGDPCIKGFGIALREVAQIQIRCHVNELGNISVKKGNITPFSDSHPALTSYTSIFFLCRLNQGCRPDFVSVTLATKKTDEPTNQLSVLYPQPRMRNIAVCHPALHGPYSEPSKLIQSFELNRVLGAEHIFIYNYSVSKETEFVLKEYEKDGVLTVLPWPIPNETNAWYYAQSTAINDCVYRNRNVSDYVAIIDVDEFIIPANSTSWIDMIQQINNEYYGDKGENKPLLGSMAFESSFFQMKPPPNVWEQIMKNFSFTAEEEDIITRYSLMPLLHFERGEPPFPFSKRSKSIAQPELIFSASIHRIPQHKKSAIQHVVSNKVAIVNHYSMLKKGPKRRVLDLSILRLKNRFFPRLKLAMNRFDKIL